MIVFKISKLLFYQLLSTINSVCDLYNEYDNNKITKQVTEMQSLNET